MINVCSVTKCMSGTSTLCAIQTNQGRLLCRITYKLSKMLEVFGLDCECVFAHIHMTSNLMDALNEDDRFAIINKASNVAIIGAMHVDGINRQVDIIAVVNPKRLQLAETCPVYYLESISGAPKAYTMLNITTILTL